MINDIIQKEKFKDIDLEDEFFDSLKNAYPEFEEWFKKKEEQIAYVFRESGKIHGFLYLKDEDEANDSIIPKFEKGRRLKIGTFKINAHGTVLGQRFLGIVLRKFVVEKFPMAYVTVFEEKEGLINLFEKFGFKKWGRNKRGELVYIKDYHYHNNLFEDYPRFKKIENKKYLLAVQPKFHTNLFPDSKLNTETSHQIEDLSFTNTLEKIYLTRMRNIPCLKKGDLILIYRTADGGHAEWTAVATSICTVVEYRNINEFIDVETFLDYCGKGSIFSKPELISFWQKKDNPHIIKMLYNSPLNKRVVRHDLFEKAGISRATPYFGFFELSNDEFDNIIELGELNESYVID